jgi:hypothetical protein
MIDAQFHRTRHPMACGHSGTSYSVWFSVDLLRCTNRAIGEDISRTPQRVQLSLSVWTYCESVRIDATAPSSGHASIDASVQTMPLPKLLKPL